jgi:hypothetical protein
MINLTPHAITLRTPQGDVTIPPSGTIARVSMDETVVGTDALTGLPIIHRKPGAVTGLPEAGERCVVSAMVLDALDSVRAHNVFAPDTGATAIRNEKGHVIAVTRLVTK